MDRAVGRRADRSETARRGPGNLPLVTNPHLPADRSREAAATRSAPRPQLSGPQAPPPASRYGSRAVGRAGQRSKSEPDSLMSTSVFGWWAAPLLEGADSLSCAGSSGVSASPEAGSGVASASFSGSDSSVATSPASSVGVSEAAWPSSDAEPAAAVAAALTAAPPVRP